MSTITHSPQFLRRRKFLMGLPLLIIPFLFMAFYTIGGTKSNAKNGTDPIAGLRFNAQLPTALFDKEEGMMNKLKLYEKADEDSIRRRTGLLQDPYWSGVGDSFRIPASDSTRTAMSSGARNLTSALRIPHFSPLNNIALPADAKANALLQKLESLKQAIRQSAQSPATGDLPVLIRSSDSPSLRQTANSTPSTNKLQNLLQFLRAAKMDTMASDPQLRQLDAMLDKVLRIQHHSGEDSSATPPITMPEKTAIQPSTSANAIPAVVQENQTLVTGATIALRIPGEATIDGITLPGDQLVYGLASINNDRMMVRISSIRYNQSIYMTTLQVYDMDGLPGIHIPGMITREVAKESADAGINSMNLMNVDPSLGAQAATAGIQAAKSLFSHKVRLVQVAIPAGYRVLLRDQSGKGTTPLSPVMRQINPPIQPPHVDSVTDYLHQQTHEGKMKLTLRSVYLRDTVMWMTFILDNRSPIFYCPEYTHCFIQDRKQMKRTAFQETLLQPLYENIPKTIAGKSEQRFILGFRPFALARDKQLVIQLNEKDGARPLKLLIQPKILLNAK